MTQRKISKINRRSDYGSDYPAGKYSFVFSENLDDWMGAKTARVRNKTERETRVGHRRDFHLKHG